MRSRTSARVLLAAAWLGGSGHALAETSTPETALPPPADRLLDRLAPVADRLRELEAGTRDRVTIVHLGDSHVQGELFTGPLRRGLQSRYGAAGRGLVLPCDVAGTNGPSDLACVSDAEWNLSRLPAPDPDVPAGLSGMTVWTADGGFILKLGLRSPDAAAAFDRITIFAEGGDPGWTTISAATHPDRMILESSRPVPRDIHYTIRRGDTLYGLSRKWGCTVDQIRKWNRLPSTLIKAGKPLIVRRVTARRATVDRSGFIPVGRFDRAEAAGPYRATVDLPVPVQHVFLRGSGTTTGSARLYGVLLDRRGTRGIAYHAVGINGAEYRDFLAADLLWKQVALLQPDLLIVTLGTNDALEAGFSAAGFRRQVDLFLERAAGALGPVPILLTGPPDLRNPRGRPVPAADEVRTTLHSIAQERDGTAYWSAADAMGGPGAILTWKQRRLASPDLVHLTAEGYRMLADRLLEDLLPPPAARRDAPGTGHGPG